MELDKALMVLAYAYVKGKEIEFYISEAKDHRAPDSYTNRIIKKTHDAAKEADKYIKEQIKHGCPKCSKVS